MDRRHGYYGRWGLGAVAAGALVLAGAVFTHADVPPQRLKTGLSCGDCTPTRESIRDPLAPSRTLKLLGKRASKGLEAPMTNDDSWVTARPTTEQRKPTHAVDVPGRNPCEPEDPGDGIFTDWRPAPPVGVILMPKHLQGDSVNVVIHFHGHELARDALVRTHVPVVLLGITRDNGAVYRKELGGPHALDHLLAAAKVALEQKLGNEPRIDHLALTSWSGGYEALSVILEQSDDAPDRVDAIALFDGPHTARTPKTARRQLEPYAEFAKKALAGDRFMFLSHSSIVPPSYASTTEAIHRLLHMLHRRPLRVSGSGPGTLDLIEAFGEGELHERGYSGGGKVDHCAQLNLYPEVLRALEQRWSSSKSG